MSDMRRTGVTQWPAKSDGVERSGEDEEKAFRWNGRYMSVSTYSARGIYREVHGEEADAHLPSLARSLANGRQKRPIIVKEHELRSTT